tara:strand:+ start:1632 stop:2117 length:486 start_codon:yes stop_codon:yes gene_type:complete
MVSRKTNRGQIIDMDSLIAQQGDRPAMGNAGTDAHGNVLGPDGKVETPAEERVRAYYEDNPMSSTAQQSLKGKQEQSQFTPDDNLQEVKTAKTQKENVRTSKVKPDTKQTKQTEPEPEAPQGESFDDEKPLGFNEVELPNGDIEMVPYYTQEEADEDKTKD